ncbi:hypothetical protein AJ90_27265 [Vibrio parahaemolyticus M0605]|nr:hypothetical protein AJ90_27265 [Vibrio parahaemolyticus M0605]
MVVPLGFRGPVEGPHCEIASGIVSSFSAALFVPRGFID